VPQRPERSVPRLPAEDAPEPFTRLVDHRPVPVPPPAVARDGPPETDGPRVRRREDWVELPAPYAGFRFKLWMTAPTRVWMTIGAGGDDAEAALRAVVLAHNGWSDEDGTPFPPADAGDFWAAIPTELAALVLRAAQLELGRLGEALGASRRR
jgi:hypothetical protein